LKKGVGMSNLSKQRRIQNEQLFRDINKQLQTTVKYLLENSETSTVLIEFYCECSDRLCMDRIELTAKEFESIERKQNVFVIKPGHNHPDLEKVVSKRRGLELVRKFIPTLK